MKRFITLMAVFVFSVFALVPFALAEEVSSTPGGQSLLDILQGLLPESWFGIITVVIAICAAVATMLPASSESSSSIYKFFYSVIQFISFNFGKATNAQDKKA